MWSIIHQLPHFRCNWYVMTCHTPHNCFVHTQHRTSKRELALSFRDLRGWGSQAAMAGIQERACPELKWHPPTRAHPGLCTPLGLRKQLHTKAFISLHFHWESCRSLGKAFRQLFECWGVNVILKNNGNLWKHRKEPFGVSHLEPAGSVGITWKPLKILLLPLLTMLVTMAMPLPPGVTHVHSGIIPALKVPGQSTILSVYWMKLLTIINSWV